jgi:hypothetical protein
MREPLGEQKIIFFFVGMKTNIKNYMMQCDIYQREKVENTRPSSLL